MNSDEEVDVFGESDDEISSADEHLSLTVDDQSTNMGATNMIYQCEGINLERETGTSAGVSCKTVQGTPLKFVTSQRGKQVMICSGTFPSFS